ncbi:hypothetical protein ABZW18_13065 [Streptomyces sp. NPDC004647]|uniref:hypothetical protein n=1 Tax=Streptomyces sp. NPDC004647 TaxID=3154671 RepID=UPI0033B05CC8
MSDQPHTPFGPHEPYDGRDPQRPYDPRHQYAPYDPYAPQAGQAPHPPHASEGASWQQPQQPHGSAGHPYEDPQTQVWQGRTYQEGGSHGDQPHQQPPSTASAETVHLPPKGSGPLPPEQTAGHTDSYARPPRGHRGQPQGAPHRMSAHPPGRGPGQSPVHSGTHSPASAGPVNGPAGGQGPGSTVPGWQDGPYGHGARPTDPMDETGDSVVGARTAARLAARRTSAAVLTPAQRARAEGLSPIIAPGLQPAALTAGLAALLAITAPLAPVLAVAVLLLQALTAAGWYRLNGMWPARQGIALAFAGGVAADAALLATGRDDAPTVVLGTLGVWCLLVIILQLRNHSSPDERLYALTAGVASAALTVLAAGHLAASAVSSDAVVVGALGVAAAALARALPLPSFVSPAVALIAAAGAGVAAGELTGIGVSGALLGLAAGGCALIGLRVASYDYPSRFVHMTAGVALPLALAAPAVYVLGRAIG